MGPGLATLVVTKDAAAKLETGRLRGLGAVALALAMYFAIQVATDLLTFGLDGGPHGSEGWSSATALTHHFWQLVLALGLIAALARGSLRDWGLNLRNRDESLRILRKFVVVYGVYFVGIGFLIQLFFFGAPEPAHALTPGAIAARLAFGFLFVGVSEEIFFRGLLHTHLARHWRGGWRWKGWEIPTAGLIAAVIFTLAHIGFTLRPLAITHLYWPQLLMALVLGVFYSAAYHRTGSLLAPILAHNFSDGALWLSEYLLVGVA